MLKLLPLLLLASNVIAEPITVKETADAIHIDTDAIQATIQKKGYVSGVARGSFVDKKTGAKDIGFGSHIMDFLMAPGWRKDGYLRKREFHGDLPKHYVEGPQICTQARELKPVITRGKDFVAVQLRYQFHKPGSGYKVGSIWEQTLIFQPGKRYFISSEEITSANEVKDLFYRIDMPGHLRHTKGDNFHQVYLSYRDKPIPASAFKKNFAPDAKFLYQRKKGQIPQRMIRAYQVKLDGKPGPWMAGMTLDPSDVCEAWCHQRGYICFIQELHRRHVKKGERFGSAYVVGWFSTVQEMKNVYDQFKGATKIVLKNRSFELK